MSDPSTRRAGSPRPSRSALTADHRAITVGSDEACLASRELVTRPARIASVAFHPLADKLGIVRVTTERSPARLAALVARVAEGKLAVSVERGYRLGEAAEAHRRMETGHVRGKIVFQLGPE